MRPHGRHREAFPNGAFVKGAFLVAFEVLIDDRHWAAVAFAEDFLDTAHADNHIQVKEDCMTGVLAIWTEYIYEIIL